MVAGGMYLSAAIFGVVGVWVGGGCAILRSHVSVFGGERQ